MVGATVSDVSASTITGSSLGLAFVYEGALSRPVGRSGWAALIADCTSRAAASMLVPFWKNNSTVALPSELFERIDSTPGTCPRWRSSGDATVEAMVLASAPDCCACTKIAGNWMFGSAATPSSE